MKVEIKTDNYKIDDQTRNYVQKKVNKLAKKLNKHQKESLHVIATLKENQSKAPDVFEADFILRLPPKEELIAKESTVNMLAAIDIVETKLEAQLRKYKDKHNTNRKDRKGSFEKLRRLADRDFWGKQN